MTVKLSDFDDFPSNGGEFFSVASASSGVDKIAAGYRGTVIDCCRACGGRLAAAFGIAVYAASGTFSPAAGCSLVPPQSENSEVMQPQVFFAACQRAARLLRCSGDGFAGRLGTAGQRLAAFLRPSCEL